MRVHVPPTFEGPDFVMFFLKNVRTSGTKREKEITYQEKSSILDKLHYSREFLVEIRLQGFGVDKERDELLELRLAEEDERIQRKATVASAVLVHDAVDDGHALSIEGSALHLHLGFRLGFRWRSWFAVGFLIGGGIVEIRRRWLRRGSRSVGAGRHRQRWAKAKGTREKESGWRKLQRDGGRKERDESARHRSTEPQNRQARKSLFLGVSASRPAQEVEPWENSGSWTYKTTQTHGLNLEQEAV